MLKLETVLKKLRAEGIKAEFAYLSGENEPIKIIRVDCDYFGPYPPKETFDILKLQDVLPKEERQKQEGITQHYLYIDFLVGRSGLGFCKKKSAGLDVLRIG